jgi:hypothetical protein
VAWKCVQSRSAAADLFTSCGQPSASAALNAPKLPEQRRNLSRCAMSTGLLGMWIAKAARSPCLQLRERAAIEVAGSAALSPPCNLLWRVRGAPLLHDPCSWRRSRRFRSGRRERQCEPYVPAFRPVLVAELLVALQVGVALISFPGWKDVPDLRANPEHARLERAEPCAGAAVAGELLIGVADEADKELLAEELRRAPVEMGVDAVLVIGIRIDEVVGQAATTENSCPVCGLK